jgi:hypothetical protein
VLVYLIMTFLLNNLGFLMSIPVGMSFRNLDRSEIMENQVKERCIRTPVEPMERKRRHDV